ncbi:raftlin [Spea bombifrons]|uniref:raftlin n=1 Tax=Spea bombifrons TaxID=233779 RepID=UPI00234B54BF|nr:raftlin [Spea bombifrons]
MGCGLNKLEKLDEKRPGNIYSTLKRPYVETKIDVSYEYRYVNVTTISQAEAPSSPAVWLSSLRDLPAHLHELYQQGFTVAAIHPFVQSSKGRERIPQEKMFRVVLIKKTERNSTGDLNSEEYALEVEPCLSLDQLADQKLIPDLVKRIEDAANQGSKFAGIIQTDYIPQAITHSPDSLSHCSSPECTVKKECSGIEFNALAGASDHTDGSSLPASSSENGETSKGLDAEQRNPEATTTGEADQLEDLTFTNSNEDVFIHDKVTTTTESTLPDDCPIRRTEILAFFNKPKTQQRYRKYYTVNIPMKVSKEGDTINGFEANWLEHMTDHFRKGCTLVNSVFYLGMVNDTSSEFTDGVFIFEDYPEQEPRAVRRYDAIVVEQWTLLQGLEVHTDYMPLLDSLAVYGWQLTCVLSTPVVKTNRDGNITTKQIVFLQRPALPHKMKKKEPKFQWRFSKDEKHSKHSKKVKGKINSRENAHTEGKKESVKNRKNEELPKIDETVDGNIHEGYQRDGDVHIRNDSLIEEVLTPPRNDDAEESQELLNTKTDKVSLDVVDFPEGLKEVDADKSQGMLGEIADEGDSKETDVIVNKSENDSNVCSVEDVQEKGGE